MATQEENISLKQSIIKKVEEDKKLEESLTHVIKK